MFRDGAFLQAYNAQMAVDEAHQIIVAAAVSNQSPDAQYSRPMFSFRGLLKNRAEWAFVCLTHNILKLFRARPAGSNLCLV